MATQNINELNTWQYETPVVSIGVDGEFDNWQYETPVEDIDESATPTTVTARRRVFEF
jgi:hypothetical protein